MKRDEILSRNLMMSVKKARRQYSHWNQEMLNEHCRRLAIMDLAKERWDRKVYDAQQLFKDGVKGR